jgi:glutamine synthetase
MNNKNLIIAEYIWIDGETPTPSIRSKTKVIRHDGELPALDLPIWGFDGSSTKQANGNESDCVLKPAFIIPDPFRGAPHVLALCEVWNPDDTPHITNERAACRELAEVFQAEEPWFGMEQEYTLMENKKPLGWPKDGLEPSPQGPYYCSAGASRTFGRKIAEEHMRACLYAGLSVSGINAEVCPGQWEYQIGPLDTLSVSDEMWMARYIMERVTELHNIEVSWEGKPMKGDWNGAGCHTNFSTKAMREDYDAVLAACEALGNNPMSHIEVYGEGITERLTGAHETCSFEEYKYGVSDRTASVRIPWQVALDKAGYIEDRRPNANCDPYKVTRLMLNTICENKVETT